MVRFRIHTHVNTGTITEEQLNQLDEQLNNLTTTLLGELRKIAASIAADLEVTWVDFDHGFITGGDGYYYIAKVEPSLDATIITNNPRLAMETVKAVSDAAKLSKPPLGVNVDFNDEGDVINIEVLLKPNWR
jgi:hypothetical protein